jgi:DNA-directed RNA polymerase specialized sigma24 family protein
MQPDPTAYKLLREAQWEEIFPKLLLYAERLIRYRVWPGVFLPGGIQPGDLAQRAVYKVLSGERRWQHEKVTLLRLLMGIIRSDLSNLLQQREAQLTSRLEDYISARKSTNTLRAQTRSTLDGQSSRSQEEFAKEREQLLALYSSDPLAQKCVELIIDHNVFKPRDLARELNINIKEVYNLKKRIQRKLSRHTTTKKHDKNRREM